MKRIIFILTLIMIALTIFIGTSAAIINGKSGAPAENVEISTIFGLLKGMTFNPTCIQIDKGNFQWNMDETQFMDEKGIKITAQNFLKKYHNRGVMVSFDSEKLAHSVTPVNY